MGELNFDPSFTGVANWYVALNGEELVSPQLYDSDVFENYYIEFNTSVVLKVVDGNFKVDLSVGTLIDRHRSTEPTYHNVRLGGDKDGFLFSLGDGSLRAGSFSSPYLDKLTKNGTNTDPVAKAVNCAIWAVLTELPFKRYFDRIFDWVSKEFEGSVSMGCESAVTERVIKKILSFVSDECKESGYKKFLFENKYGMSDRVLYDCAKYLKKSGVREFI